MKKLLLSLIFLLVASNVNAQSAAISGNSSVLPTISTATNCASSASPAVCGSAIAGHVNILTGNTIINVQTTALTANSQIIIQEDQTLGTRLGVTCNTTLGRDYVISARTAGVSFSVLSSAAPAVTPACLSYLIVN